MIQHIRRKVGQKTFSAIEQGERTFEVGSGNYEVEVGDFITFEERDDEGNPTKRRITRKVSYVINTNEIPHLKEQAEKNGLAILGLVSPIYQTLGSVFSNFYCVALGFEVIDPGDNKKEVDVTEGPHYLPPYLCPALPKHHLINDSLRADTWPLGVYSAILQIRVEGDEVSIVDTLIFTFIEDPEDGLPRSVVLKIEPLVGSGDTINAETNKAVTPVSPGEMREYESDFFLQENIDKEGEAVFPDEEILG